MVAPCRQNQHIPGVLPPGIAQNGQLRRQIHGQILQAVHRQLRPPLQQGPVQLLDEEALSPHRLQGTVQNTVSRSLHGHKAYLRLRQGLLDVIRHQAGLDYGQPALPAADPNASSHSAISRILAAASFTAR